MSQIKIHDRDFFFKYFTFEGAKKTLEYGTFLYKSPAFFNDPFDSQITLQPGISEEQLRDVFFNSFIESILEKRPEPRLGLTEESLKALPPYLDKKGLYKIKDTLLNHLPSNFFQEECRKAAEGQREYFKDNFVFCVTEEFDNLLMWSHYADEHKGIVIKINCIEEKESLLCAAHKVTYSNQYPSFGTANDWRKFMNSGQLPDLRKIYNALITTKSTDWEYENEWRMIFPRPEDRGKKSILLSFHVEEIDSVYLGCNISETNKVSMLNLLGAQYPLARVYQARRSTTEFQLYFDRII